MNFRTRLYKPALLALAAILFCVVAQMQGRLNVDRKELGLTRMDPLENAPPVLAFTTVPATCWIASLAPKPRVWNSADDPIPT